MWLFLFLVSKLFFFSFLHYASHFLLSFSFLAWLSFFSSHPLWIQSESSVVEKCDCQEVSISPFCHYLIQNEKVPLAFYLWYNYCSFQITKWKPLQIFKWFDIPDSEGKESACSVEGVLIPGLGKSPGEGNGNPLQFLPEEFHGQRSLAGYCPWDCKELDTTEWLIYINIITTFLYHFF